MEGTKSTHQTKIPWDRKTRQAAPYIINGSVDYRVRYSQGGIGQVTIWKHSQLRFAAPRGRWDNSVFT